jgi:hypothetical protein
MRSTVLAAASLAVLASACASGGSGASSPGKPTSVTFQASGITATGVAGMNAEMAPDRTVTEATVSGAPAKVLEATQQAYLRLGIPVTASDPVALLIGNAQFRPGRRFLDEPMSAFVQCGNDHMGAPLADKYQVTMDVRTVLVGTADGNTRARTTLAATARDRSGTSSPEVRCATRGVLEQRIGTTIQLMAADGGAQ